MRRLTIAVLLFSATAYAQIGLWTAHPAKGAPFSADVVSQSSRVLSDGNRIHRTGSGKMFRDSEGRTRSEFTETRTGQPVQVVIITDPVAQISVHYTIASQGPHVARVHPLVPHSPAPPAASGSTESSAATARQPRPVAHSPSIVQEDLGISTMEGLAVRGSRTTHTVAAGEQGNEEPIVHVEETWRSEELHEVLRRESDDPHTGHSSMTLTNIDRSEPDPALFQVPPDYTVEEEN